LESVSLDEDSMMSLQLLGVKKTEVGTVQAYTALGSSDVLTLTYDQSFYDNSAIEMRTLQDGAFLWTDRTTTSNSYPFGNVPTELIGIPYFSFPHYITDGNFTFSLSHGAGTVYIYCNPMTTHDGGFPSLGWDAAPGSGTMAYMWPATVAHPLAVYQKAVSAGTFQIPVAGGLSGGVAFKYDPVSGVGDPHMTTMRGERFQLMQPGIHTLIHIPRAGDPEGTLLRVDADAQREGDACAEMYFQSVNVSGRWADAGHTSPEKARPVLQFSAKQAGHPRGTNWFHVGKVDLKIVWGRTVSGIEYLNVFTKDLEQAGYPIGGLLGEDDHTAAATPSASCKSSVQL